MRLKITRAAKFFDNQKFGNHLCKFYTQETAEGDPAKGRALAL